MASSPPRAQDPLDALQLLVNAVLVQTGKALRASRKDSQGSVPPIHGSLQARLPDTIKAFHTSLDDLERDIIRAKSVLLRDLTELQAQRAQTHPAEEPLSQPVKPRSTSPTAIDLDSSSPAAPMDYPIKTEPGGNLVAPFPDMGMNPLEAAQLSTPAQEENSPSAAPVSTEIKTEAGPSSGLVSPNAVPMAEQKPTDSQPMASGADDRLGMHSGLNFTDMEFTLAPTKHDALDQPNLNVAGPSFDLASFAPADGAGSGSLATLGNNIMAANLSGPAGATTNTDHQGKAVDGKKNELPDSTFADILTGDGQADGMDFDFSLGDGSMGGDTFDDLMNDRDNTFDTIEHGDFDVSFFGLDKSDNS